MRVSLCPACCFLHASVVRQRTRFQESLHEACQEFTTIDLIAAAPERTVRQRNAGVGCIHLGELLQCGNQGSSQRDGHFERAAKRPFFLVVESTYFLAGLNQFLIPHFRAEGFRIGPHQRSDIGKSLGNFLERRGPGLDAFDAEQPEVRADALYFSRQFGFIDLRYLEADLYEFGSGSGFRDLLSAETVALADEESRYPG